MATKKIKLSYLISLLNRTCVDPNYSENFETEECIKLLLHLGVLDESRIENDLKPETP